MFVIASSIGTPIYIDSTSNKPSLDSAFGYQVRVLVDQNLVKELRYKVLVEKVVTTLKRLFNLESEMILTSGTNAE